MLLQTFYLVVTFVAFSYGYPISGSWFKEFDDKSAVVKTLNDFQAIGGSTVIFRGATLENRTADDIKKDPIYKACKASGVIGKDCVDKTITDMAAKGINIELWMTYTHEDDYSDDFITCKGFDEKIKVGEKIYTRQVIWTEQSKTADDCSFKNGSNVGIVFTYYSGKIDPNSVILDAVAGLSKKMDVYFGLAKVPRIDNNQASADFMQVYYAFVYRIMLDHQRRYKNNTSLKGYYSDEVVIPSYIVRDSGNSNPHDTRLPAKYVPLFLRELMFLASSAGFRVISAPMLDLTKAGNTTLDSHILGVQALNLWTQSQMIMRDGRGEGYAAYYSKAESQQAIYTVDRTLFNILKQRMATISAKTTFEDVYYASISEFFDKYMQKTPENKLWLMVEAYDAIVDKDYCSPIDPKGSGMDKQVKRVQKQRLDRAIADVGSKVSNITAFAWDPLFLCKGVEPKSLLEEIQKADNQPIISECRFHSQKNQSIVLLGFSLAAKQTQKYKVTYTLANNKTERSELSGYYFELDYGEKHGLTKGLQYTQLYDIPDLKDIKKKGTITVQAGGVDDNICSFDYILNQ